MTQPERITLDLLKELLNNVTRNTNFLFGTETIQHGTIKAYLDTQRQQHQFYNKLEYFSDRPGLQQQKQEVPFVPHRKTLLS